MSTTITMRTHFEQRARDLMHQAALLTLDLATGRTRDELRYRIQAVELALHAIRAGIERGDPLPEPEPGSYWERFMAGKQTNCEKCVYFRTGYVPAEP